MVFYDRSYNKLQPQSTGRLVGQSDKGSTARIFFVFFVFFFFYQ